MRSGFLGAIVALAASAGLASGQASPAGPSQGRSGGVVPAGGFGPSPIIPPQSGAPGGQSPEAAGVVPYPPPANWEAFDPNGPPGEICVPKVWFSAEYLLWFGKNSGFRTPLVTTGAQTVGAMIGAPTTNVLYPRQDVNDRPFNGMRITTGMFFDLERRVGIEGSGFGFDRLSERFFVESQGTGTPTLARPFLNTGTGGFNSFIVAAPTVGFGSVEMITRTQAWSAELSGVLNLFRSSPSSWWGYNLTLTGGLRHFGLAESFDARSNTTMFDGASVFFDGQQFRNGANTTFETRTIGTTGNGTVFQNVTTTTSNRLELAVVDRFRVSNEFFGGQMGLQQEIRRGRWLLGLNAKLALGDMHSTVDVQGYSNLTNRVSGTITRDTFTDQTLIPRRTTESFNPNIQQYRAQGGLYALSDTIGRWHRDRFAIIPDFTMSLGYQFTPTISGFVGYNFVYVSHVVRVTDVVSGQANPNLMPYSTTYAGGTSPSGDIQQQLFSRDSNYWLHGVNFGLTIRY